MSQPSDTFAHQTRRLASEVQRRRDWAGGDPARLGAVADALVDLTGHRLSGHLWAEAASGVQEAVTLAARVLAQHGPVGPYTPRADAVRSITALVQLAVIQSAAGLHAQAEQALAAAFGLREQLSRLDLDAELAPRTIAWALLVWTRAGLAAGEVAAANARADAAVAVTADDGEFVAIDVDRVASDARWAAGCAEPAVEYVLRAVERYEERALAALESSAQLPPALLERLSEPLFGLYSEAADRVLAVGAPGLALTLRRRLVDLLGALAVRSPDAQQPLVAALTDLADDLRGLGRNAEADDLAELAASVTGDSEDEALPRRERARLGARASWTSLPPDEAFGVRTGAQPGPSGRLAALRGPAGEAEENRRTAAEAELARRAREAEQEASRLAVETERLQAEQRRLAAEQAEREAREAAEAAELERLERQRKRAERIAEHERQLERERAEAEAALRARVSDETDEERAEREELERLAAELAALETAEEIAEAEAEHEAVEDARLAAAAEEQSEQEALAEAERLVAEEAERAERERVATEEAERRRLVELVETQRRAEEEAERLRLAERAELERLAEEEAERQRLAEQAENERLAAEEAEPESLVELVETPEPETLPSPEPEPDALEHVRASVEEASATGKRRDVREATEALVDELRGRYEADPEHYLDEFLEALDQLATARWQAGDWWGSRGPAKEAKTLRKRHGR